MKKIIISLIVVVVLAAIYIALVRFLDRKPNEEIQQLQQEAEEIQKPLRQWEGNGK